MNWKSTCGIIVYLCITITLAWSVADESTNGTIPLFADGRILTVYSLATLPLGSLLARRYLPTLTPARLIGAGTLCLSVCLWPYVAEMLSAHRTGWTIRHIVRSFLTMGLVLPICLQIGSAYQNKSLTRYPDTQAIWMSVMCCVALPLIYVSSRTHWLRTTLEQQLGGGRVAQQLRHTAMYWELYGDDHIGQQRMSVLLKDLKRDYRRLVEATDMETYDKPTIDVQFRARQLLALDRPDQAEKILSECKPDAERLLLRALANRELKRWAVAEDIAEQLLQHPTENSLALEILGESLHRQRRYDDSRRAYQRLLLLQNADAVSSATIHIRIAQVYMDEGNRAAAWEHFELAKQLDSRQRDQVNAHQRSILQHGCQLR